jgi:hypothetical protein
MSRSFKNLLTFVTLCSLLGCSSLESLDLPFLAPEALPSSVPSSTPDLNAAGPSETVPPLSEPVATETFTPSPIPATINPTLLVFSTPTLTPTLDPTNILLRIAAPGPMSKVVSPINFVVYILPDFTGTTRIQLLGEDGRELFSKVFRTFSNIGYTTRVDENIGFEIHGAAEIGRLQISTADEFGRMQAFNSVRLLLLSVGKNEISQAYAPLERVLLRKPKRGDTVSGGVLTVDGEIQPVNNEPIIVELYDNTGNIMGSRILALEPADGGYQFFSTTIPYETSSKQVPARLMIRQSDDRIPGLAYLYSLKILIDP